jgi:hypothetical protein
MKGSTSGCGLWAHASSARHNKPKYGFYFDSDAAGEIAGRIQALHPESAAQWGKMSIFQMLRHCTLCEDMMLGHIRFERVFIGRLIGKMILKKALKEGRPFGKNSPTNPALKTHTDSGDFERQRKEWLARLQQYANFSNHDFTHPFFGRMTKDQVGVFVYKHADHHLRQFGG